MTDQLRLFAGVVQKRADESNAREVARVRTRPETPPAEAPPPAAMLPFGEVRKLLARLNLTPELYRALRFVQRRGGDTPGLIDEAHALGLDIIRGTDPGVLCPKCRKEAGGE